MHRPDSCTPTGFRGARAARLRATINLPNQDNHVHHETALYVGKRESIVDDFYIRTRARRVLAPPAGGLVSGLSNLQGVSFCILC